MRGRVIPLASNELLDAAFRRKNVALSGFSLRPKPLKNLRITTRISERRDTRDMDGFASVLQFFRCLWLPPKITSVRIIHAQQLRRFVMRSHAGYTRILHDIEVAFSIQWRALKLTHIIHHHKGV